MDLLDKSVDDFEWSVRCANCLRDAHVFTLKDLISKSEGDLLRTKNFGRIALREVKEVLAKMGLRLRDDDDDAMSVLTRR